MQSIWHTVADSVHRLATADPRYVLAALALYIVSLFIAGARWRGFLHAMDGDVTILRATMATVGGVAAGNLTPAPGGETCRIALVRAGGRITWRQATIAAVWDRLSELPPIVVLSVMALVAVRHLASNWRRTTSIVAGVAAALILGGFAIARLRRSGIALAGWRERLALDRVSGRVFATGVGYSTLLWLQDVLRLTCATFAFGVTLSPTRIATLSILAMIGGLVPAIGGVGPVEGGLVAGLMAFGVDVPTAAAVTAVERAISYGFSTSAGALVIALVGGRSLWTAARSRQPSVDGDPVT